MPASTLRYLSRADVVGLDLPWPDVREAVHRALVEKGRGETDAPPKRGIDPDEDTHIRAMTAFIPSLNAAGCKWISGFPRNVAKGLPTINGLMILNELETGLPVAVMDCTWITAVRTAACTAVSARYLARADSRTVGIVACGLQGRVNLEALAGMYDLEHVRCFDIRREAAERFAAEMGERLGLEIEVVDTPPAAVRERDIVVTSLPAPKHPDPPVTAGTLSPGGFACLLDFDACFDGRAMRECDTLVTDDLQQVAFFKRLGWYRTTPEPDADLGKICAGRQRGRESDDWRTIAINMGIGLLDVAVGHLVLRRAEERGVGVELPL
jgi:ornithine cyclodeaminase/alanine dehydrogenase